MTAMEQMQDQMQAVEVAVEPLDASPYFTALEERFGIPRAVFDAFVVFRSSAKRLSIARRGLRVPARPRPETIGMPFYRTKSRYPRMTNATAMRFGHHATKNVVDLVEADVERVVRGEELSLEASRSASLDGMGWVLLRYRGLVLAIALFYPSPEGGKVVAQVPRTWKDVRG